MAVNPIENDKTRHIGLEFEFASNANSDLIRTFLNQTDIKYHLGDDGSIDHYMDEKHYEHTHELRILTTRPRLKTDLKIVESMFLKFDCNVNKSCGLHVHLDCRNYSHETMYKSLLANQKIIFSVCDLDRRKSGYCYPLNKAVAKTNLETVTSLDPRSEKHYEGINISAIRKHRTIEIRCHEATLDFTEIHSYVRFLYSVGYKLPMAIDLIKWRNAHVKRVEHDHRIKDILNVVI